MPQNTPRLGLPKGLGPDNAAAYLKGSIAGGGLWRALEVLDDAVLQSSVNTLNNVTLTSPNIGPEEWGDAQHTHASAATAGSTLGPGTTLSSPAFAGVISTGAQFAGNVGVGVAPAAWAGGFHALQVGALGLLGQAGTAVANVYGNSYYDGTASRPVVGGQAGLTLTLQNGALNVLTAPSVAAGAAQTFTSRLMVDQNGTLTLTPGAQPALAVPQAGARIDIGAAGAAARLNTADHLEVNIPGGYSFKPAGDNSVNNGFPGYRWVALYAVNGSIQTSSADLKDAITPLDPAAALAAVLATDPVVFDYRPPERDAAWYELPDDPEQAEAVLHQRLTAAPLEAGARHQSGFVLADDTGQYHTDPLFETGAGQSNAANSVGVLLAALHEIDRRLTALEEL